MRVRHVSILRAPATSIPFAASTSSSSSSIRWTASAASRRRQRDATTANGGRPSLFCSQFSSQRTCLREQQQQQQQPQQRHTGQDASHRRPTSVAGWLAWKPADPVPDVAVQGFVRSVRSMKKWSFVTMGDGSSLAPLQAVVPANLADGITNGAAVRLEGVWAPSPGAGQSHELRVHAVKILGPSDAKTFPIQKKYQSPEFLRTLPHLRPRIPFNATLLRFRSDVVASINRFFADRAFVQTHPPLITSSDCEGGGEVFSVASLRGSSGSSGSSNGSPDGVAAHADEEQGSAVHEPLFFRSPKYLTVSTQLHLEALAQAVGSVWTLSPTFRAEASDTPRHLSEFYMLEAEMGFVDELASLMDLVEDLVRAVAAAHYDTPIYHELLQRSSAAASSSQPHDSHTHQQVLDDPRTVERRWQGLMQQQPKGDENGRQQRSSPHRVWPRLTYTEAIDLLAVAPVVFDHAPVWGMGLQTEHEKYLAQTVGGGATPVFVTHYPRAIKAFYMLPSEAERVNNDEEGGGPAIRGDTVACFDLLVPDFCEVAGGSLREHRLPQLLGALQARGLPSPSPSPSSSSPSGQDGSGDLDWYVDLRRWGCPPHGGFGLGLDRLLCYLTGVQTVRDMVAFPRWYGRCNC
ncbi:asparaginyl-tRNA synthetase [Niveomyces insectorum RCEF 264]|uniref:asparagine--tRNA ligase n=1 Tax=Niveomyces insectorum RCEF 264 TaxID=1081102 RepID=A0A162J8F7_9HYPO|nr:asparaginyl-tRNA synthetase [Niveomyces insectorum RCEF 264]